MPNTVPAAGEAMPSLHTNRRRFLLGLAAASTAAALPVAVGQAAPSENPQLIALASELPAISDAYQVQAEAIRDFKQAMRAATPLAPDELTELGTGDPCVVSDLPGETETWSFGGYLYRLGEEFPRRIVFSTWKIDAKIALCRRLARKAKKHGSIADFLDFEAEFKRLRALHLSAKSYESAFREAKAKTAEDYKKLQPLRDERLEAFANHVAAIMDQEDLTMEGLVIKAEALAVWDRVESLDKMIGEMKHGDWHGKIAASILRHAEGGAANV